MNTRQWGGRGPGECEGGVAPLAQPSRRFAPPQIGRC
jgi:hypothetical protein